MFVCWFVGVQGRLKFAFCFLFCVGCGLRVPNVSGGGLGPKSGWWGPRAPTNHIQGPKTPPPTFGTRRFHHTHLEPEAHPNHSPHLGPGAFTNHL
jgi:hypothetical protein